MITKPELSDKEIFIKIGLYEGTIRGIEGNVKSIQDEVIKIKNDILELGKFKSKSEGVTRANFHWITISLATIINIVGVTLLYLN